MIHKTLIGVLMLATLGTVVLWAFAFFGGPYAMDWDLTDQLWVQLELRGPASCQLLFTYFPHLTELAGTPLEPLVPQHVEALKQMRRQFPSVRGMRQNARSTTLGFRMSYSLSGKPGYQLREREWDLVFPFWAPLLLFAAFPTIVFVRRPFRRARRLRNGWCVACGYDLRGNVSGICSECGQVTSSEVE